MNPLKNVKDSDIRGSWPALLRAAKNARRLAETSGTPFYIFRDGRIVDLNRQSRKNGARTRRRTA